MSNRKLFLYIVLLLNGYAAVVFGEEMDLEDVTHLDVLVASTKNDLSDLVGIAEAVVKHEDEDINDFVKTTIANKLFDFHFYLAKVTNPKTIDLVCDTDAVFLKGIRRVYGQCIGKDGDELCLELDNLDKACSLAY